MAVSKLTILRYAPPNGSWDHQIIERPSWPDIEQAIRQLDRCVFPSVALYAESDIRQDESPDFEVVGGQGAYYMELRHLTDRLTFRNPNAGTRQVEILITDHAASVSEKQICTSLDMVLRAAQYFFEHLEPDPESDWAMGHAWEGRV